MTPKIPKVKIAPKMGEVVRPRQERNDGWSNLVTLLGTSGDKRTHSKLNWENRPPEFYEQLYAGGGIPARIVDLIPDESLRRWLDWTNAENDQKEQIEERCQALDFRGAILKTWKWARAYGGACLHIVTDTTDPGSPLQPGEKVIGLIDLSRWDLRILTTDVEYDFGSPNWGHPRIYYLNVQMGSQYKGYPIHWTRMVRFDGQLVPRRTYIRNNYWHDSILNRIYNSIRNYETSNDAAASALQDFNVDVYKLKNVANLIGAGKEAIVQSRINIMNMSKSLINAMILDADQESYENVGRSLEGVAELLTAQANRLVADTDIPHTKLLGESPDGSNATGNATSQSWYNFIASEQENYLKPKLHHLINVIFPEKKDLGFKFRPLRVLDDVETSDLRYKVAQTDQIYNDIGALDPSEITESRFGGDEYSMETKLDEEAREAGLIVPGSGMENPDGNPDDGLPPGEEGESSPPAGKSKNPTFPPKKSKKLSEPGPSEPEPGNDMRGAEGEKGKDITGKPPVKNPKTKKDGQSVDFGQSEFEPRNTMLRMGPVDPKVQSFISQTMSEPFRDPKTDPHLKGPGIPNKARTILPTRGNGVTAPSGADFIKDAGKVGAPRESTQVEPASQNLKHAYDSDDQSMSGAQKDGRSSKIIVRDGDKFLMGKRRDNGRWTFPGGHVAPKESHHQGAVRELKEETDLDAPRLKFLGARMVEPKQGQSVHVNLYEHHPAKVGGKVRVSNRKDPDNEFSEFKWLNRKEPLPEEIAGNLHHPNDIALDHLGLLK